MKVKQSGATYSKITVIGETVKKLEKESGEKYLYLNQGVNAVCNINLTELVKLINFNSRDIQVYQPMKGRPLLKQAINKLYFNDKTETENILITSGGMAGLDIVFQSINVDNIYLPQYFWGSYMNIIKVRNLEGDYYYNFAELNLNIEKYKNSAVIICDPNNPIGDKFNDEELILLIKKLNNIGTTVIIDSPYRKVFLDEDKLYETIYNLPNVIIIESFSKSIGLSGQRIGFVHTNNTKLNDELAIKLMYASNGVNGFAQVLVEKLFTTKEGLKAINNFRITTTTDIKKNIEFLKEKDLLASKFYKNSEPKGIFTVVNLSEKELLAKRIASVSLSFFTRINKKEAEKYARICVSVPHNEFVKFF